MFTTTATVIALCFALTALDGVRTDDSCSTARATRISFSVSSRKNSTGHRLIKASVHNRSPLDLQEAGATEVLTLNVDFDAQMCDGGEQLSLEGSLEVPPNLPRPSDYELVPGMGFYKLHLSPLAWDEARRKCITEGAHLAIINSELEAKALAQLFARAPKEIVGATYSHVAAIGFHDKDVEGQYVTIFGQPLVVAGYNVWGTSQPNNAATKEYPTGSNCGGVERSGKLNDLPCRSLNAFFCEQEL